MVDGKNLWWPKNWICQKKVHTVAKNKAHTKFLVVHNFNFLITKTKVGSVGKTDDSTANTRGSRRLATSECDCVRPKLWRVQPQPRQDTSLRRSV